MSQRLKGKVAVVTGASKGIGAAIATHLAREGAAVVVNYASSREGADRVVGEIKSAGGLHNAGIFDSAFKPQVEAQTPLGRIGQPQDIAPAAVFFASDESRWITGETLHVSGGNR